MGRSTRGESGEERKISMAEESQSSTPSVEELVGEQRKTEEIALRLFRFKTRRGIGVAYSFASVMVILTLIAANIIHFIYLTLFVVAITPATVVLGSGLFGYRGIVKMNYAVGLARGRIGNAKGYFALEILTVILLTWPWLTFTALENFGYTGYTYLLPIMYLIELFIFLVVGYRTNGRPMIIWRIEDTVFFASLCIASLLVIFPAIGTLGFEVALPVWILSAVKALYDAPKEVVFEHEP